MPRILLKDVLTEIRSSRGRFLSILLIVALGTAFFAGIKASAPDMKTSADQHFDRASVQDVQVYSTLGFEQQDLDALQKVDGVEEVQGQKSMDALMKLGSQEQVVRLFSWKPEQKLNLPRLTEGRMPQKKEECVLEASTATGKIFGTLNVGDTISLYSGTDVPLDKDLALTEFTIVGKAYNPNYLSYEKGTSSIGSGSVDTFIYIDESVFDTEYYTEADVTVSNAKAVNTYTDAYFALTDPVVQEIENLADTQIAKRIADLQQELDDQKAKAQTELENAQKKLEEAREQLDSGKVQLDSGEKELARSQAELDNGEKELAAGQQQLAEVQSQIQSGYSQTAASESQLADAKGQLDAGWSQYYAGKQQLEQGQAQVSAGIAEIEQAQAKLPALQAQKESIQTAVSTLTSLQQALEGLQNLQAQKSSLEAQLAALQAADPESDQIAALQGSIADIDGQIAAVASQVSNGAATDAAGGIAAAQNAIAQLQQSIPDPQAALAQTEGGIAEIQALSPQLDQLRQKQQELNASQAQLESSLASLQVSQQQYDSGTAQLQTARDELAAAENQYAQGQASLQSSAAEIQNGTARLQQGTAALQQNRSDYEKALQEYQDGLAEYEKQKQDAEQKIAEGQKQIDELDAQWIVLDRDSHYSYRDYESCADRMDGIASVFPVFFFLVAALVCMTTMTRMVQEERTDIGTLKALGYTRSQIAFKYITYAGLASLLGCAAGCGIGMMIFPAIIFYAWNTMYNLEAIVFTFPWDLIVLSSVSVTGIVLAATLFSIYRELTEVPSQLMRPKAAKAGKKIFLERLPWLWKRVSFMHKVTLRNLFRDKKRFFMTTIGIAGCSALLVAGFGLNDSISDIVPRQFGDIYHYNATVTADQNNSHIIEELQNIDGITSLYRQQILPVTVQFDHKDVSASLNILENPEAFADFMTFIPMENTAEDMKLDDQGVFISVKTAEKMHLQPGDEMEFTTADNQKVTARVTGIFDQYIDHQIYCTQALFDSWHISEKPDSSYLLINAQTDSLWEADLGKKIMELDGIKSVTFYSAVAQNFLDMLASIKMVVLVLVFSAAMLAFVVLYNLSNVNISERMREIATVKVLGFTEKETNQYINRETLLLSILGAVVGLWIGIYLHGMIMNLAELDSIRFGRTIAPLSFLLSFLLTIFFTLAVNWIMKFRLRKIEMVESLKAVE